jgi:hypothetical protein
MEFFVRLTDSYRRPRSLLKLAAAGTVRILTADGRAFVLEDATAFEKEVALLGKSKKFQRFLTERSKEPATTSLEDYRRALIRGS